MSQALPTLVIHSNAEPHQAKHTTRLFTALHQLVMAWDSVASHEPLCLVGNPAVEARLERTDVLPPRSGPEVAVPLSPADIVSRLQQANELLQQQGRAIAINVVDTGEASGIVRCAIRDGNVVTEALIFPVQEWGPTDPRSLDMWAYATSAVHEIAVDGVATVRVHVPTLLALFLTELAWSRDVYAAVQGDDYSTEIFTAFTHGCLLMAEQLSREGGSAELLTFARSSSDNRKLVEQAMENLPWMMSKADPELVYHYATEGPEARAGATWFLSLYQTVAKLPVQTGEILIE